MQEVKEGLKLDNLRTDHVMIRSELKYLIGEKIVDLKCRVFGGQTAPFPTVRVFRVVRPVATVQFRVEPIPEPTWEFVPVANATTRILSSPHFKHGGLHSLWHMRPWLQMPSSSTVISLIVLIQLNLRNFT
jgi:hypothetical protein